MHNYQEEVLELQALSSHEDLVDPNKSSTPIITTIKKSSDFCKGVVVGGGINSSLSIFC